MVRLNVSKGHNMITNAERKGDTLILTVKLNATPVQSKSALAKALAKGLKPEDVPATLLASTGGFAPAAGCKVSLNVITAS